jgi:hypothetical protein
MRRDGRRALARAVLVARCLWPLALVGWVFLRIGHLGFNPTDEGYVLAQAHRLLLGDVPHRDFVSPRPVLSGLLHLLDHAVPGPLFVVSRFIALVEIAGYSLLFASLIFGAGPHRWGFVQAVGAAASILVNLNSFPLMAWYTIDGILLVAAGLVLVEAGLGRRRSALTRTGLLCLGLAPLAKQSFIAAPLLGILRIAAEGASGAPRVRLAAAARNALLTALPALGYVALVGALGGFPALVEQLGGARLPSLGAGLLNIFRQADVPPILVQAGGLLAILTVLGAAGGNGRALAFSRLALRAWLSWLVMHVTLLQGLDAVFSLWGLILMWILALVVIARAVGERSVDGTGLALVAIGWMTLLSWGWAVPDLVAGSMALCVLDRVWRGVELGPSPGLLRVSLMVAAAWGGLSVVRTALDARETPYRDRPARQLTVSLGSVSQEFGAIRTNPVTARSVRELAACVRRVPTCRVAVVPDNAWIYPALGLQSPLPVIWFYPPEFAGSEARILDAADRLHREADYLVIFQTVDQSTLAARTNLPIHRAAPYLYRNLTLTELHTRVRGLPIRCPGFVATYHTREPRLPQAR